MNPAENRKQIECKTKTNENSTLYERIIFVVGKKYAKEQKNISVNVQLVSTGNIKKKNIHT